MKKTFTLIFACSVWANLSAQQYTKIHDNPNETVKGYLAVEYFGIDWGSKNMKGTMFYTIGVNGSYPVSEKIRAEAYLRTPLLRADVSSTGLIFEGGGNAILNSSISNKNVRIVLGYKEEQGINTRTATVKYVNMPVSVKKSLVARGGVYLKTTPFKYDSGDDFVSYKMTSIFHKGIYAGIGRSSEYFTHLQSGGQKFAAGSFFMPYADLMILPTSVDAQVETFGMGGGATTKLKGLVGARVGFKWIRNPFTKEQNFGRKIPFFGHSVVGIELGHRPLEGIYFGSTVSYAFKKFK